MLLIFSISMLLRIAFNFSYIFASERMCRFMERNPKSFSATQSAMYLVGEALPIMSIFVIYAIELVHRKRKSTKSRLDTPNSL